MAQCLEAYPYLLPVPTKTKALPSFMYLAVILSITSRISSSQFTTGTTQLNTANYAMAVGYDAPNDTILLFGGFFSQKQLTAFQHDTLTLINANFLTNAQQIWSMSQYYTQLNDELWAINPDGSGFIKINTNTRNVEVPSVTISDAHVGKCLTSVDDYLIVIGGDSGTKSYGTVAILRITDNQWLSNVPSLSTERTSLSCVVVDHIVYAIAGFVLFDTFLDNIETLDVSDIGTIATQTWNEFGAVLDGGRRGTRSVVVNTDIWVIGGFNINNSPNELSDVNVIDTLAVNCYVVDTLSYETSFAASIVTYNDEDAYNVLYAFGGCAYQDGSGCTGDARYQYTTIQSTAEPTTAIPTTTTSEPTILTSDPTVLTSHPTVLTSNPTVLTSHPTILTSNPTVLTSHPTVLTSNPTVLTPDPTIVTSDPTIATAEPTILTSGPTTVTSDPSTVTFAPTILASDPTAVATSLTSSSSQTQPSDLTSTSISENPSTKARDREGKVVETYESSISPTAVKIKTPQEPDNILVILLVAISSVTVVFAILCYVLKYFYVKRKKTTMMEQKMKMEAIHIPYPAHDMHDKVVDVIVENFIQTKMVTTAGNTDEAARVDEIEGEQNNIIKDNKMEMEYTQEGQNVVKPDTQETKEFGATAGATNGAV